MKAKLLLCLFAGCLITLAIQDLSADEILVTSQPMSAVLQNLQSQGIVSIQKVELDGGVYKIKAINAQGQMLKLEVNPQTGALTKPAIVENHLNALQAVRAVEASGYRNVYKVEANDGEYRVKAIDSKGSQVGLDVDGNTGKIDKKWFS